MTYSNQILAFKNAVMPTTNAFRCCENDSRLYSAANMFLLLFYACCHWSSIL